MEGPRDSPLEDLPVLRRTGAKASGAARRLVGGWEAQAAGKVWGLDGGSREPAARTPRAERLCASCLGVNCVRRGLWSRRVWTVGSSRVRSNQSCRSASPSRNALHFRGFASLRTLDKNRLTKKSIKSLFLHESKKSVQSREIQLQCIFEKLVETCTFSTEPERDSDKTNDIW